MVSGKRGRDEHGFGDNRDRLDAVKLQLIGNPKTWQVGQRQLAGFVLQRDFPEAGVAEEQLILLVIQRDRRGLDSRDGSVANHRKTQVSNSSLTAPTP